MAIEELSGTQLLQRCAACGSLNQLALDALEAGVAREGLVDAGVVPLPACATCGAREFLIRADDDEPEHPAPGSVGHLHRLLVGEVHAELVAKDRLVAPLREQQKLLSSKFVRRRSAAELREWFPDGLKLRPPVEERAAPAETNS